MAHQSQSTSQHAVAARDRARQLLGKCSTANLVQLYRRRLCYLRQPHTGLCLDLHHPVTLLRRFTRLGIPPKAAILPVR